MRIGLYGLPTAGKSFLLDRVRNFETLAGSTLLKEISPDFHDLSSNEKCIVRKKLALNLKSKDNFIMDGHYAFGNEIVFTEEDGMLYDTILYLYIDPEILKQRMSDSKRNYRYLNFDLKEWQELEIRSLRAYCHKHDKDFYIIDEPQKGMFTDISIVQEFINSIASGLSNVSFARKCADEIANSIDDKEITLADGDKTLILEDSSALMGYATHIFDGNFYTGFQSWRHDHEFTDFLKYKDHCIGPLLLDENQIHINNDILQRINQPLIILTSGYYGIWSQISDKLHVPVYYGIQMSADTKYFITKFLQEKGFNVSAFGDSMNDYYMLRQADKGYLVARKDGTLSRSLKGKSLEGIDIV